jgi:rubrerythrin
MSFKTKTEQNLHDAFAGESMANRKYLYFAKVARELGAPEVAELFERTAKEETAHAFMHLDLIYPKAELTVERLLALAVEGETYETQQMYPAFQRQALEEENQAAAAEFHEQAKESAEHAERFRTLLHHAGRRFGALTRVEAAHAARYQRALDQRGGEPQPERQHVTAER